MKVLMFIVLLGIFLALPACGWVTGDGEKIGTVIKVAKEGTFVKTWEAEIIRGGMANGSGGFSSQPFYFTIDDESMLPEIQKALDSQKEIKVHYKRRFYLLFKLHSECHGDECNFLTGIN